MALRSHALVLVALCAGACATGAIASERPAKDLGTYHACTPNTGKVVGTNGIYFLRARNVGCVLARKVVRRYHAKRARLKGETQTILDFVCTGSYTESFEGLQVSCRRPGGRSVGWTAYIVP
jgi:hypothetical protein